jgi:photosystem II stability/assembly factor-like uncharacterized protein
MFKKICFSVFFICLLYVSLRAEWQRSGFQYATHSIDISASVDARDSLVVFVADSTYRLYKSKNVGSGWSEIGDSNSYKPSCVLAIPGTDTVFISRYMGIGNDTAGIYRSVNNGDDWHFRGAPRNVHVLTLCAWHPPNSSELFAGCDTAYTPVWDSLDYTLFKTYDGGEVWGQLWDSWPPPDSQPEARMYLFAPLVDILMDYRGGPPRGGCSDQDVYLAQKKVAEKEDEQGIWWVCHIGFNGSNDANLRLSGDARTIAGRSDTTLVTLYAGFYSGDSMGVWKTTHYYASDWVFLDSTAYPITTIAVDPTSIEDVDSSNDTLYVGTDGYGIMRSTDGGSTWSFVNTGIRCKSILDIKVDPVNNSRIYAGAGWSFYVSTDYGQTWTEQIQGMKKAQISGVASNAPAEYCIGEFDNFYKSTDGGSNWTTIYAFEGKPGFEGPNHSKAKLLTVDKDNPNKLFATVFVPSLEGGHNSDRILRSTDGGLSWRVVFDPTDSGLVATSLVIDPQDSNTVYATYDDPTNAKMVMKSTSEGDSASWSAKISGFPNDGVLCLTVDPTNHNTLYVGTKANGVYKNMGGGDSSWTQTGLTNKMVRSMRINEDDVDELYAGTSVGVYRSVNAGVSWSLVDSRMVYKDVYSLAMDFHSTHVIYAASLDPDSNGHIYRSTNSGIVWSEADSGLPSDWVVFTDNVPYINLQTDSLVSGLYVFLGTKKGLFKQQLPSPYYSGHITQNTTWGPGTVYLNGDVTVDGSIVLTIDSGTTILIEPNFDIQSGGFDAQKCELIIDGSLKVKGTTNDSIKFLSSDYAPSDSDWHGITGKPGGSARFNYCDIRNAYSAIYDSGSAHDSVTHCRFKNNFMQAVKTKNSNLLIDSCVIENDSVGGSDEIYGILCYYSSPSIKNTLIRNCKYGIKCVWGIALPPPSPLIEECGFYNIGEIGIWLSAINKATVKSNCFKGAFGKTCIQVDKGSPMIYKCYMASEGSSIPIGMLFQNGAGGSIRRSTIWDYDSCAVEILASTTNPDFGTSDSAGNNWFEGSDHYYFISSSSYTIKAELNDWDTNDSATIRNKIYGNVDFSPFLDYCSPPTPYYPVICSNLPPSDPTISPCKIAVTNEEKIPKSFSVSQNYPNPFNPQTVIKYDLPEAGLVRITIYNLLGQKVRTLVDEDQETGYKSVNWDGKDDWGEEVATGIYFYKIKAGDFALVKKMVLLK